MTNSDHMPIGPLVIGNPAERPVRNYLHGKYVTIAPLNASKHADALWENCRGEDNPGLWKYMHAGPFADKPAFDAYVAEKSFSEDPLYFAIVDKKTDEAVGHAAYMRIEPGQRVIEVGSIVYTPALQKTRGGTEAMYLMARNAFENLGYRRYEWKCNALNEDSKHAARRLGFSFEGVFRQHMIVKGRSRDTAWFSMLDSEWPDIKREFERWLAPENFDPDGNQKTRLAMEGPIPYT